MTVRVLYTAYRVHTGDAAGRLERHIGRGVPQHSSLHRREGNHAPRQSETQRVGAGEDAEKCQNPSRHHRRDRSPLD